MDVIGIGTPVMDMVINVDQLPERDKATGANEVFFQGGGKVATAMAAAARLGLQAAMTARVGSDAAGRFIRRDFEYNGVDTSHIAIDEGKTSSFCLSLSESCSKTRNFIGRGSTARPLSPEELDADFIRSARFLHLESGDPASVAAARIAKKSGVTVCMDGDHYTPQNERLLPDLDVFIGSSFFKEAMFGDKGLEGCCRAIRERGPSVVLFTLGSRGCAGLTQEGYFELPAFQNVTIIDTTGAGDVFHGAYIAAMLEGKSAKECARFASAVSAIKCASIGGRTGIPTRKTVEHFLETGTIDLTESQKRLQYYRQSFSGGIA